MSRTITETPKANIDAIKPERSLINLDEGLDDQFSLLGYAVEGTFNDVIFVEYLDIVEGDQGDYIERGGVLVPLNSATKAWRIGKVLLAGTGVHNVKKGDLVCFPNDRGLRVSSLMIVDDEKQRSVKNGVFLNEERLFGKVRHIDG